MTVELKLLDSVFGSDSIGDTPEERAKSSKQLFVRSQHQLSVHRNNASGRVLSAAEALRIFGWDKLKDLADRTATPIVVDADEPYASIERQLRSMDVNFSDAARKFNWSKDSICRFEQREQVPFRDFERLAQGIDLDEDQLGTTSGAGGDHQLGVRLRTFKSSDPKRYTVNTVLALSEAAWTIRKQFDLASLIQEHDNNAVRELGFTPSDDYGSKLAPDYIMGYRLASRARELLNIPAEAPIESLKELIEIRLRIPVIQLELQPDFAGATIATGSRRGIAINLAGGNSSPLVRRMTMAHELGHLLWDPDERLDKLRVDRYEEIDMAVAENYPLDHIERRANAFAIEFLAPRDAIISEFKKFGEGAAGLEKVITTFGVSKVAIAHHLSNASHNLIDVLGERLPYISYDEWEARESLAVPLFDPKDVPISRKGRFAYYVYRAFEKHLISDDTAASLYRCKLSDLSAALKSTKNYIVSS
jgi:Zn-dependent peptidase ImmA (M78 family)